MMLARHLGTTLLLAAMAVGTTPALAQGKFPDPERQLKLIVPFAPGGGVDGAARLLGEQLRKQLGLTVIVDNRAGANGTLGGRFVQTQAADGYTLLFSAATHVHVKQVMAAPPYDPQTDFAPVARVAEAPLMLVISPQLPQTKLSDVLAAAKQQSEGWTAAIPAAGAPAHLATLLLASKAGIKFTYVPYKGTQPAAADVAGGHANLLLDSMISLMPLAKAGRVKPIAMTTARRSALAPDIPTVQEGGIPGFSYVSWYGVWAPKDTAPDRIALLNNAINKAVAELGKSGAFANLGIEPVAETTEQFRRHIAADAAQGAELLKNAGFKAE